MKNIFRYLFLISICLLSHNIIAQPVNNKIGDVVMPPPSSAALGKYVDVPVSYYTGVPSINIPITSVSDGSLSLPISLNYHAGGIRVGEPADRVGLGWSLNAGGMISRTVQGIPDEQTDGYLYVGNSLNVPSSGTYPACPGQLGSSNDDYMAIANGQLDGEPDIFSFNVGGYTGKFYFNPNGDVILVPLQDLKIEYEIVNNYWLKQFTIITSEGTRYIFGDTGEGTPGTEFLSSGNQFLYPTGWKIKKIESQDKLNSINFDYEDEVYSYRSKASWSSLGGGGDSYSQSKIDGKRLSSITTRTETISFIESTELRQDLDDFFLGSPLTGATSLEKIEISTGNFCKEFNLSFDYWEDNSEFKSDFPSSKRLKLLSLQEQSCDGSTSLEYSFDYYGKEGDNNFLPDRLSPAIDHWGYYNGKDGNWTDIASRPERVEKVSGSLNPQFEVIRIGDGDARESNEFYMKWGTLKQITYPTGGTNQFEYEGNEAANYAGEFVSKILEDETEFLNYDCFSYTGVATEDINFTYNDGFEFEYIATLGQHCSNSGWVTATINGVSRPIISGTHDFIEPFEQGLNAINFVNGLQYTVTISTKQVPVISFEIFKLQPNVTNKVGGLRVSRTIVDDGENPIIKTYEYPHPTNTNHSSGHLFQSPRYWNLVVSPHPQSCMQNGELVGPSGYPEFNYTPINYNYSVTPLSGFGGSHIGYEKIIEHHAEGSKEFIYLIDDNYNDSNLYAESNNSDFALIPDPYSLGLEVGDIAAVFPYPPSQPNFDSGNLLSSSVKNSGNSQIALTENFKYEEDYVWSPAGDPMVKATRVQQTQVNPASTFSSRYRIRNKPQYRLASVTEVLDGVSTITSTEYNGNNHYFPTATSITNSDGKVHRTEYTYPIDQTGSVADSMKARYMIGIPTITKQFVDGQFIGGSETVYGLFKESNGALSNNDDGELTNPYPRQFRTLFPNENRLDGTISRYWPASDIDGKGKPKFYTANGWNRQTFTWKNGMIKTNLYKGSIPGTSSDDFKTKYTYYTGTRLLKSITNIDGTKSEFTYDSFMRLETSKSKESGGNYGVTSTTDYQIGAGNNQITSTTTFADGTPEQVSIQNFDGLGRPTTTSVNGIVKESLTYDNLGRVIQKMYLPGSFSTLSYEPSPLNRVTSETYPDGSSVTTAYGSQGNFYQQSITDENGNTSTSVTDILGRNISTTDALGNVTSYEYEDRGNLVTVKPPNWQTGGTYEYVYDDRNRLESKTIPAGGTQLFKYNTKDQLVLSTDANMLAESKWMGTIYDEYGRPDETGFVLGANPSINFAISETLTKTFYDNETNLTSDFPSNPATTCVAARAKGKVVGTKVKVLDSANEWIFTRTCYNTYGIASGTNSTNHLSGTDEVISTLNLADIPLQIQRNHNTSVGNKVIVENFTYDNFLRQRSHQHGIGANISSVNSIPLTYNIYNDLDQLTNKKVGGINGSWEYLQEIDYKYNTRGWLTHINDVENSIPGNEPIPACNDIPDQCAPECDFSLIIDYSASSKSLEGIYDLTLVRYAIPQSIPLGNPDDPNSGYPYWIGSDFSTSINELYRFKTDLLNWMEEQSIPIQDIVFTNTGSGVRITMENAKTRFHSISVFRDQEVFFNRSNCETTTFIDEIPSPDICSQCTKAGFEDCATCPYNFKEINPTRLKIEYDHNALVGGKINPSLIRITETSRYVRADGLSFIYDKVMVRPVQETSGEKNVLAWEGNTPFTTDMSYVMDIDLQNIGGGSSKPGSFSEEIQALITTEVNNAGINSSASQALQTTINEATVEQWVNNITVNPLDPGVFVIDNPDLFALQLVYNDAHDMIDADPQKNGNISGMIWKTAGRTTQSYSFQYDKINRLISGLHQEDTGEEDFVRNNYNVNITYDNVGNIERMIRNGVIDNGLCPDLPSTGFTFGEMDNLEYTYNGNQLHEIEEEANADHGYKGGGGIYDYDANGNMISDGNKGITISYNHLNLPKLITFDGTNNQIQFTYDAAGIKLKKVVSGEESYTLHYIGGIEYRKDTEPLRIESLHHSEGRVTFDENNETQYEYHLKDHLGNVRVVFADKDGDGYIEPFNANPNDLTDDGNSDIAINLLETEVLQETHYYPFGMAMEGTWQDIVNTPENNYLYNGKELNSDFGLDWLDYGARMYDPAIARWNAVDPLAEKYYSTSGYTYVLNNPLFFVDPDGKSGEPAIKGNKLIVKSHFIVYGDTKGNKRRIRRDIRRAKRAWNKAKGRVTKNGKSYKVKFKFSVEFRSDSRSAMIREEGANLDDKNLYLDICSNCSSATSEHGNSMDMNINDIGNDERTLTHEYGHVNGWLDSETGEWHDDKGATIDGEQVPGIMTARNTSEDAPLEYGLDMFGLDYTNDEGTIDASKRSDPSKADVNSILNSGGKFSEAVNALFNKLKN